MSKWIDKKNATTFEVVHRSREDPLYYDDEAPSAVLLKKDNLNTKDQKQARKDKWITGPRLRETAHGLRDNEGEAALYGITFDDSSYDYMQHLRTIGEHDDAVFVAGGASGSGVGGSKGPKGSGGSGGLMFKDDIESKLPAEVLASEPRAYNYQNQQGIQDSISGLQPDMDPRLREVLEALEDDEYVEGDVDDLFEELTTNAEQVDLTEFEASKPQESLEALEKKEDEADWEYEFRKFKLEQKLAPKAGSDVGSDFSSEFGGSGGSVGEALDTVGELPVSKPRKKKIGAKTDLTGFSMSSSANFRNKGLELLDDRFDQVEAQYNLQEESEEEEEFDMAKERPDLESIMDDFLENEVVFGKKLYKRR